MNPRILVASLILTLSAAGPAASAIPGKPQPGDARTVETCLSQAKSANTATDACIGSVARACQATAATPQAKLLCNEREESVWNSAVARDSADLMLLANGPATQDALRAAETAYQRSKLSVCMFERILRQNSPDGLLAASNCTLNATARFDIWLGEQLRFLVAK